MDNAAFSFLLNDALPERERIFKLSTAVLNPDDSLVITLLILAEDYDNRLDEELRAKVEGIIKSIIPSTFEVHVVYRKTETTEKYVVRCLHEYFYKESSLIFPKIKEQPVMVDLDYAGTVKIALGVPPDIYSYLLTNSYDKKLSSYLETQIMEAVEVQFFRDTKAGEQEYVRKKRKVTECAVKELRVAKVEIREDLLGTIAKMPMYVVDATKREAERIVVCGKISRLTPMVSKKGSKFLKFSLNDTTATVECLCFPRTEKVYNRVAGGLHDTDTIVCEGELKADSRSGGFVLFVKMISLCNIDYSTINTDVIYKSVPEDYYTVSPERYIGEEQGSIFDEEQKEIPELLRGNLVVFDLETTGFSASADSIIEIGAVRLVDGKMKETFATLVNPERPIPEEASNTNHIYDSDVSNAPTFREVVGDFYKFCYGATLVAHNASFDLSFLSFHGKANSYNFDNPSIDTMQMAQTILKRGRGVSLPALCKLFNIDPLNAHRALYDALACANVLLALTKLKKQ